MGLKEPRPNLVLESLHIERSVTKPKAPVIHYLSDRPKLGIVREGFLVVPPNT